jgi:hypothetical protein
VTRAASRATRPGPSSPRPWIRCPPASLLHPGG